MKIKFEFEELKDFCYRSKVIGGWIVTTACKNYDDIVGITSVFVPDKNHEWEIEKK